MPPRRRTQRGSTALILGSVSISPPYVASTAHADTRRRIVIEGCPARNAPPVPRRSSGSWAPANRSTGSVPLLTPFSTPSERADPFSCLRVYLQRHARRPASVSCAAATATRRARLPLDIAAPPELAGVVRAPRAGASARMILWDAQVSRRRLFQLLEAPAPAVSDPRCAGRAEGRGGEPTHSTADDSEARDVVAADLTARVSPHTCLRSRPARNISIEGPHSLV